MSFGSRLGNVASRLGLGRLGALPGFFASQYRDVGLRLFLDLKTVHSAVRFALAKTKDASLRFPLRVQAYRDTATRTTILAQGYKNVASRIKFYLTGGPTSGSVLYYRNLAQRPDLVPTAGTHSGISPTDANSGSPYENRAMSLQRGNAQTSFSLSSSTGTKAFYLARFTSPPLAAQHVGAGNWVTAGGLAVANSSIQMMFCDAIYVWRPSTSSVVATIRSSTTNANTTFPPTAETWWVNTWDGTNGGAGPAFDTQEGDVLVVEIWCSGAYAITSGAVTFYFDGADATKGNGVSISDAASSVQAPQALQFISPADARTRFKLLTGNLKDVRTLVWIRLGGYAFTQVRYHTAHFVFRDQRTRMELKAGATYSDASTRTVFRPLAYREPQVRLNLPTWTYKDVAGRLALRVATSIKDVPARCKLQTVTYPDCSVRFQLEEQVAQGLALLDTDGTPIWQRTQASDF